MSILNDVKEDLGIMADYDPFDASLIMDINLAFSTLIQLGVSDKEDFSITGDTEDWSDFIGRGLEGMLRKYVSLYTRILFDPPSSSAVLERYNEKLKELEWRLNVAYDKLTE